MDTYSKVFDVLPKGAYNDDFDHRATNRLVWIDTHPHQTTSKASYAMTYATTTLETECKLPGRTRAMYAKAAQTPISLGRKMQTQDYLDELGQCTRKPPK